MKNVLVEDNVLVERYIKGDEDALTLLLERHKAIVFGYIYKRIKNKELAEDFFQDTFIKVIHSLKSGRYNESGRFLPWVIRIAHNIIIDHFRRDKRSRVVAGRNLNNEEFDLFKILKLPEDSVEDNLIKQQILNKVKELIEYLPTEQKEIIYLRFYKELSFSEIADDQKVSINTALGRMRYALINLRKIIERNKISLTLQ